MEVDTMSYAEFTSLPDVKFTCEALDILTMPQLEAIHRQMGEKGLRRLSVFIDFSLPTGYVYVVRHTLTEGAEIRVGTIHMGIDPEGRIST